MTIRRSTSRSTAPPQTLFLSHITNALRWVLAPITNTHLQIAEYLHPLLTVGGTLCLPYHHFPVTRITMRIDQPTILHTFLA